MDNLLSLSKREKEVFDLYVTGLLAKEVADILCVHVKTIKFHMSNIFKKLHVKSKSQMIYQYSLYKTLEKPVSI